MICRPSLSLSLSISLIMYLRRITLDEEKAADAWPARWGGGQKNKKNHEKCQPMLWNPGSLPLFSCPPVDVCCLEVGRQRGRMLTPSPAAVRTGGATAPENLHPSNIPAHRRRRLLKKAFHQRILPEEGMPSVLGGIYDITNQVPSRQLSILSSS